MPKDSPEIDRQTASLLLNVSVRTIDRYIRRGLLLARQEHGRIWLDKKDILHFEKGDRVPVKVNMDRQTNIVARPKTAPAANTDFYRDLYEEAKKALHEYQQKLEQANYRIGQLESHALHPAANQRPLIERRDESVSLDFLRKDLADRDKEIFVLKDLIKKEKNNRIAFTIVSYLLLALLPALWYLLR